MTNVISSESPPAELKKQIRPFYFELQGYLDHAPEIKGANNYIDDKSLWERVNNTIKILGDLTKEDYSRFRIIPQQDQLGDCFITVSTYHGGLAGIIYHIHSKYFFDEPASFRDMPNTIFNNQNNLQQSQQQTMTVTLLELQSKIDQKLPKTTDEKEKSFLQKLKDQLPTVISVIQLIQLDPAPRYL